MILLFGLVILVWFLIMVTLLTPRSLVTNRFDRLTKGKYRKDRVNLQIMLDHLRSFPDQWSITREGASFPKEGAKQIYLTYDETKDALEYSLASFGRGTRPLEGHFGHEFKEALLIENNQREQRALLRDFYPNLDGPLLLK